MQLAEVVVKFRADTKSLNDGFSQAQKSAYKLAEGMRSAGAAITLAVAAPLALLTASTVSAAREMDGLRRGLTTVAGSANAAARQLESLNEVAKLPGLGFREAIRGSTNLQAAGFSAAFAERALAGFGNALATVGRGKADLDGVTRALTQIAAKGKVSAEEINQLAERVPQIRKIMRDAFGTADTERLQRAGIDATTFLTAIVNELNKLPKVTGGVGNAFENMSDAMFRARAAIGEALLPALLPLVEGLTSLLTQVRTINPETLRTALSFAAVAAAIGPLIIVGSSLVTAITAISTALSIGLLPLIAVGGPILIALGLVAAAFVKTGLDAMAAAADAEAAAERFRAALRGMDQATLGASLAAKSQSTTALIRARNDLERELAAAGAPLEAPKRTFATVARARLLNPTAMGAVPLEPQSIANARERLATINGMINDRAREMGDISRELNARQQAALVPHATPIATATSGVDKMRGARDTIEGFVREMETLRKFAGAFSIEVLPDNVQQTIRDFEALRNRADQLRDALGRMGSAAPSEGFAALAALDREVEAAKQGIDSLAANFNRALLEMSQRSVRTQVDIAVNPIFSGNIRAGVDNSLETFGASLSATGSLLGNLSTPLGLAGTGLLFLRETTVQAGRTLLNAFEQAASMGGQFISNLQNSLSQATKAGSTIAAAAPQAIAFGIAMEVATGFFQSLAPAIEALTLPFRMVGEILSSLIVPVLKIIFPVFKVVAIVASYLGETIARVVSAILNAAGGFVKGLGKLINAITPFANPGNPLVRAGEALQRTAGSFSAAADEMRDKRKELQGLTFEGAMDRASNAADRLSESLTNVPPLFDLALRRTQAGRGMSPGPVAMRTPTMPSASVGSMAGGEGGSVAFNLNFGEASVQGGPNATPREIVATLIRTVASRLATTGDPRAHELADLLRLVGA